MTTLKGIITLGDFGAQYVMAAFSLAKYTHIRFCYSWVAVLGLRTVFKQSE